MAAFLQLMLEMSGAPDATTYYNRDSHGPYVETIAPDWLQVIPINFRPSGSGGVSTMEVPLLTASDDDTFRVVTDWMMIASLESGGTTAIVSIVKTYADGTAGLADYVNVAAGNPAVQGEINMHRATTSTFSDPDSSIVDPRVSRLTIALVSGGPVVGRIVVARQTA